MINYLISTKQYRSNHNFEDFRYFLDKKFMQLNLCNSFLLVPIYKKVEKNINLGQNRITVVIKNI